MNYKVGDTVVCISAKPGRDFSHALLLRAGEKYVVAELNPTCVGLEGVCSRTEFPCIDCRQSGPIAHFDPWRFIKLDGLTEQETSRESITA